MKILLKSKVTGINLEDVVLGEISQIPRGQVAVIPVVGDTRSSVH